jgi:hypothetical protein
MQPFDLEIESHRVLTPPRRHNGAKRAPSGTARVAQCFSSITTLVASVVPILGEKDRLLIGDLPKSM